MKIIKSFFPKLVFLLILISVVFSGNKLKAQNVLDDIYQPEHVPVRKPVTYNYLREADVMWKKKLWRMIDLRQKINLPLYYPTTPIGDRYSLIDLILYGVEQESMTVYDVDDDQFTTQITPDAINENLGAVPIKTSVEDTATGELVEKTIVGDKHPEQVTRYLMKEIWYFDKQRSMLQVRILGLCPIRMYEKDVEGADDTGGDDGGAKDLTAVQVLWVYYPAFRNLFATHVVFNTKNDAERRTFEDIFSMRRFSSYIFEETNVYDNRLINQYTKGLDSILESNKVQDWIRNWEHDLWEY